MVTVFSPAVPPTPIATGTAVPGVTLSGTCASICITDRKSTRLNSSHLGVSYAVFCLKENLRSGTDKYHGDAFEYLRNPVLDANDYFLKQAELAGGEKNKALFLRQNAFGASTGFPAPFINN